MVYIFFLLKGQLVKAGDAVTYDLKVCELVNQILEIPFAFLLRA